MTRDMIKRTARTCTRETTTTAPEWMKLIGTASSPARSATALCDYEVQILRELAGQLPGSPWGAAVGATLGFLKRTGMVALERTHSGAFNYEITSNGRAELARRGFGS